MNEIKEIKIDSINNYIFYHIKKIRQYTYEIMEFIGVKSEKNNNQEKIDIYEINNKIEEIWKNSITSLKIINHILKIFNSKHFIINVDNIISFCISNKNYNKFYQRNNFYVILYKNIINFNYNYLLNQLIQNDIEFQEFQMIRIRLSYLKLRNLESKTINEIINEFIKNYCRDKITEKQMKEIEKDKDKNPQNIYFNCDINTKNIISFAYINIKILNFHFYIKFPVKYYNPKNFFILTKACVRFINEMPDNPENLYDIELFQMHDRKNKKFLLIDKMEKLIQKRIFQINKSISKDINNIKKEDNFLKEYLVEFCKRFIYYIHDYNRLFKTKCGICENIVKYSINEKCFFPPYYKIYRERSMRDFYKNNEDKIKLFYHEECLRKINLPCL